LIAVIDTRTISNSQIGNQSRSNHLPITYSATDLQ
jgi:hypothetical protein